MAPLLLSTLFLLLHRSSSFTVRQSYTTNVPCPSLLSIRRVSINNNNDNNNESRNDENTNDAWDSDVNYDKDFNSDASSSSLDPALNWNAPPLNDDTAKLGINIGQLLEPLSPKDAAELKAAATEIINDAVAAGLDDITLLRKKMKEEFEAQKKTMQLASELEAQRQSDLLMSKIDRLTEGFLKEHESVRKSTRLAAAADRNMEGKGLELGVWGNVGGASVASDALLGSVSSSRPKSDPDDTTSPSKQRQENRIVIIADTASDDYAKKLLPPLTKLLEQALPNLILDTFKPSSTLPLGGNNAACVVMFATSLSDATSVKTSLDRLLRKTLSADGSVGTPPTQIVLISTLGTERTNKMPYSMQNLMSGGALKKRLQMEEGVVGWVQNTVSEPPLDYTICKLGELKDGTTNEPLQMAAGDALDGSMSVTTAALVVQQAIAYQPSARNATLSAIGAIHDDAINKQDILDDAFLRLDGPELFRMDLADASPETSFAQLAEYVAEWAELLAESGKGLTTPIRFQHGGSRPDLPRGVIRQQACQLVFLATATGKKYLSKEEERQLERTGAKGTVSTLPPARLSREGGIEFLVEVTTDNVLRVRAKRCNYAFDAVIKELSESTIMNRFKQGLEVWKKDYQVVS